MAAIAIEDDDAILFTLAAKKVNTIQWIDSGTQLIIGTAGGEWIARSDGPVLTPTDIDLKIHTTHGSADVEALRIGNATLFLHKSKRKVREFAFNFEADSFRAPDLTILADHITRSKVTEITYQQEPDSLVWAVRTDGVLATMTYRRNQDVVGWGRQILGGAFSGGVAVVESVAVIPGNDGSGQQEDSEERDEVWAIVKRTIDGGTKRYIEFFEKPFEGALMNDFDADAAWKARVREDQKNSYYTDSLVTLDSPATISGATAADPVVITTSAAHGFSNGDRARITGIKGMTEINAKTFIIANKAATTFELTDVDTGADLDGSGFTAYVSGGEARVEVTAITGLDHLEGEAVTVLADGKATAGFTVSSGAITLANPASKVHVGLKFKHRFKSLKNIAGAQAGTGVGRTKRINTITYLLLDAAAFKHGKDFASDSLEDVTFQEDGDPMDEPTAVFTGEKRVPFPGSHDRDARIVLESELPLPFTLLGFAASSKLEDHV